MSKGQVDQERGRRRCRSEVGKELRASRRRSENLSPTLIRVQLEDPPPASTVRYVSGTISVDDRKRGRKKDKHAPKEPLKTGGRFCSAASRCGG